MRNTICLVLLSLSLLVSCDSQSANAAGRHSGPAENHDVISMFRSERSLVSVWLSPTVDSGNDVPFRLVNIVYHCPDIPNAAGMTCRPVMPKSKGAVIYEDLGVKITVKPKLGKRWSQVKTREDLSVDYSGLL